MNSYRKIYNDSAELASLFPPVRKIAVSHFLNKNHTVDMDPSEDTAVQDFLEILEVENLLSEIIQHFLEKLVI